MTKENNMLNGNPHVKKFVRSGKNVVHVTVVLEVEVPEGDLHKLYFKQDEDWNAAIGTAPDNDVPEGDVGDIIAIIDTRGDRLDVWQK